MKTQQWRKARLTILAGALALGTAGGVATALPDASTRLASMAPVDSQLYRGPQDFALLVERVKPAVVNISTRANSEITEAFNRGFKMPELPEGTPFGDTLRRFFDGIPEGSGGEQPFEQRAAGSGFIISADGYVVTSDHVVARADEVMVVMDDGTRYPAQLKGRDPKTDLALLKIEAGKALPFVELGDSDKAKVGEWVVAVGNPFGLGGSVTAGIISARGRDIQSGPYVDYLQVDAPINRGNSGGPLFDTDGRVIGINTAIYSPTGGNVGIGFAVPSTMAKDVIEQLKASGRIERAWLGVQVQQVTEELAQGLGLPDQQGALISDVVRGSPADAAGMQSGDVIYKVNGERLKAFRDLPKLIASAPVGGEARFEIWRNGDTHTLTARLESMPSEEPKLASKDEAGGADTAKLGVYLAELTPQTRQRLGLSLDHKGVLVVDVEPGSPAAKAGIRSGGVIEMVDHDVVNEPDDVLVRVKEAVAQERPLILLVAQNDGKRFIAIRPAAL